MTRKEPHSTQHQLGKVQGLVWMALAAILGVRANMLAASDDDLLFGAVVIMAILAYVAFVLNVLETNRYALPVLRLFGKEEWSYHYRPPEGAA